MLWIWSAFYCGFLKHAVKLLLWQSESSSHGQIIGSRNSWSASQIGEGVGGSSDGWSTSWVCSDGSYWAAAVVETEQNCCHFHTTQIPVLCICFGMVPKTGSWSEQYNVDFTTMWCSNHESNQITGLQPETGVKERKHGETRRGKMDATWSSKTSQQGLKIVSSYKHSMSVCVCVCLLEIFLGKYQTEDSDLLSADELQLYVHILLFLALSADSAQHPSIPPSSCRTCLALSWVLIEEVADTH